MKSWVWLVRYIQNQNNLSAIADRVENKKKKSKRNEITPWLMKLIFKTFKKMQVAMDSYSKSDHALILLFVATFIRFIKSHKFDGTFV